MGIVYTADIDRIKELAKSNGLSMKYLAEKIGKYPGFLSCVRNGTDRINDDELQVIADLLNTTPEYLKGKTDTKEKPAGESTDGLSDYDARLLDWFHSLPPEKRQAILEIGDGPKK